MVSKPSTSVRIIIRMPANVPRTRMGGIVSQAANPAMGREAIDLFCFNHVNLTEKSVPLRIVRFRRKCQKKQVTERADVLCRVSLMQADAGDAARPGRWIGVD